MSVAGRLLFDLAALAFWAIYGWFRTASKRRRGDRTGKISALSPGQTYGLGFVYGVVALQCILWLSGSAVWISLVMWTLAYCGVVFAFSYTHRRNTL